MHSTSLEYVIDREDRIVATRGAWNRFALDNGGPTDDAVLGRSLWSFISPSSDQALWHSLIQRSRATRRAISLRVRCDAPSITRVVDLTMTTAGELTTFTAITVKTQERAPIAPVQLTGCTDGLLKICSWCQTILIDGRWVAPEELMASPGQLSATDLPPISHGACPSCLDRLLAVLDGETDAADFV